VPAAARYRIAGRETGGDEAAAERMQPVNLWDFFSARDASLADL